MSCKCSSKDEVSAICPIHNMIWMGTITGTIMVFHAPTLNTKFASKLTMRASNLEDSIIVDIQDVSETSNVLITKENKLRRYGPFVIRLYAGCYKI